MPVYFYTHLRAGVYTGSSVDDHIGVGVGGLFACVPDDRSMDMEMDVEMEMSDSSCDSRRRESGKYTIDVVKDVAGADETLAVDVEGVLHVLIVLRQ